MRPALIAIAVLGAAALAATQEGTPPAAGQETHKVARGTLKVELNFDATFEPAESAPARCRPEAYPGELAIAEVAPHGRSVKKGDVLIRFETKKIEDQIRAAENELLAAKAAREKAEEESKLSERGERLAMETAQREAKQAAEGLELFKTVTLPTSLKDLELDVLRYEDSIADQREELDQLEKMYKSEELTNATAEIVVKRAKRQLERSRSQLEITKVRAAKTKDHDLPNQLEQVKAGAEQSAHNLEVLQKTAPGAHREKEAALMRSRLEVARQEENLAKLREDVAVLTVRAPMGGTVYYGAFDAGRWSGTAEALKTLRVGEKAQAGQTLMTVVGSALDVRLDVAEKDLHQFTGQMRATVAPVGFPSLSWEGVTTEPAPIGSAEGTFEAKVKLGAKAQRLVAGMKCKVTVHGPAGDALLVPVSAVMEEGARKTCMLKGSDKPCDVKIGRSDGKMVEILEGLKEGDEVVVQPKK